MKSSTGQWTLILLLMLAMFLQIEGVMPDIFAGNEEPVAVSSINEGLEFSAVIDGRSFTENEEVTLKVTVANISGKPVSYYSGSTLYGIRGALRATLSSVDGEYRFSDKFVADTAGIGTDADVLEGELLPGKAIECNFTMLPYYFEDGVRHKSAEGEYVLKLSYSTDAQKTIQAEFPIKVVKRFRRISIKG